MTDSGTLESTRGLRFTLAEDAQCSCDFSDLLNFNWLLLVHWWVELSYVEILVLLDDQGSLWGTAWRTFQAEHHCRKFVLHAKSTHHLATIDERGW